MNITKFHAENVHGYLSIDVDFFEDLTFLIGLNGSGKTSALRLIMALLTPNLEELNSISFSRATVTVNDNSNEIIVSATKNLEDDITLSIAPSNEFLKINGSEFKIYMKTKQNEGNYLPFLEKYQLNSAFQQIREISTPMFLGLDRRFYAPGPFGVDEINDIRRREMMMARRIGNEDVSARGAAFEALREVNLLSTTKLQEVRGAQERLDEQLRTQFFSKAFEYKPRNAGQRFQLPSRTELDQYREQLLKIGEAAEGLKIPVPEIQLALTLFFERMNHVIESLEKGFQKKSKKAIKLTGTSKSLDDDLFEWIINKPQVDRIIEHLRLLDKFIEDRNALRDPINRFVLLVNKFLEQTKKSIIVAENGRLLVSVFEDEKTRPISALSSGERQLLVMLAHLSLNPNLAVSGIFIVDEPELSLHIDWQEKFVDAIREANPNVQIILATHSPAIILDRIDDCHILSERKNA